jgi:hypothetical protein
MTVPAGTGLEQMGSSLEELQPRMNSAGTEMGNLTRIMEVRERMKHKIRQIEATKDLLEQEMTKKAPVDELNEELATMRSRGEVNPYIKLLHEWKKQHELERESGTNSRSQIHPDPRLSVHTCTRAHARPKVHKETPWHKMTAPNSCSTLCRRATTAERGVEGCGHAGRPSSCCPAVRASCRRG